MFGRRRGQEALNGTKSTLEVGSFRGVTSREAARETALPRHSPGQASRCWRLRNRCSTNRAYPHRIGRGRPGSQQYRVVVRLRCGADLRLASGMARQVREKPRKGIFLPGGEGAWTSRPVRRIRGSESGQPQSGSCEAPVLSTLNRRPLRSISGKWWVSPGHPIQSGVSQRSRARARNEDRVSSRGVRRAWR